MKIKFQDPEMDAWAQIQEIYLEGVNTPMGVRGIVRCFINREGQVQPHVTWSCYFTTVDEEMVVYAGHYFFPDELTKAEADFAKRAVPNYRQSHAEETV